MSELTFRPLEDGTGLFAIDLINGEWATAYNVTEEDVAKMKIEFDYDYIADKYGWV